MTREQLKRALDTLHWRAAALAYEARCDESLARKWLSGVTPIPPAIADWLAQLEAAHRALPAPKNWRVREAA